MPPAFVQPHEQLRKLWLITPTNQHCLIGEAKVGQHSTLTDISIKADLFLLIPLH